MEAKSVYCRFICAAYISLIFITPWTLLTYVSQVTNIYSTVRDLAHKLCVWYIYTRYISISNFSMKGIVVFEISPINYRFTCYFNTVFQGGVFVFSGLAETWSTTWPWKYVCSCVLAGVLKRCQTFLDAPQQAPPVVYLYTDFSVIHSFLGSSFLSYFLSFSFSFFLSFSLALPLTMHQ